MKWAILILAFGGLVAVTVAADHVNFHHLFGPTLQPIHYLGRDAYDLSASRRQPSRRAAPAQAADPN